MLGKHVWELLHHPDKLWVQLLSVKYLQNSHIFDGRDYIGASFTWISIMKAAAILYGGFITRVGCGNISLWYERWLHNGRLCDGLPFVHISDTNLQICDVVQSGIWNFNILATQIPVDIKLEMQSIILNNNYADLLIWEADIAGTYSTKNAYRWLLDMDDNRLSHDTSWQWIWKLQVAENIRFFVWLIMHGRLQNNSTRFNKHMTNDASCPRRGAVEETIMHTLRDCPKHLEYGICCNFLINITFRCLIVMNGLNILLMRRTNNSS
jgi:hypothetical protein